MNFWDIRGLHSNLYAVHYHLETARPALLFLTETQIVRLSNIANLQYLSSKLEHNCMPHARVDVSVSEDLSFRHLEFRMSGPVNYLMIDALAVLTRVLAPVFKNTSLITVPSINTLGLNVSSDCQYRDHLESKASNWEASVLRFRLVLYRAHVRPYLEYCSHLWAIALQYPLDPFDRIQRRAV